MQITPSSTAASAAQFWTGIVITGLVGAFLLFDGLTKILRVPQVVRASAGLGLPAQTTVPIGCILLACTAVYLVPRTTVLGAILLTGYLGGAVAIQLRAGGGAFPISFSAIFGVLVWVGLVLRDPRLGALILPR